MRTWFWTLLVFVAAVGLALVLRDHSGNVLIIAQPWRIELSLTLAILLVLASFLILYLIIRVLAWLSDGPQRFRSWRTGRAQKRDHETLESGWVHVLEGRYSEAEKELSRLMGQTRSNKRKILAALASARASHLLGEYTRRDQALEVAKQSALKDQRLNEAVATVTAEMYLDQNRPQDALVLLQPLQDASSRYLHATRLLLRAHLQLRNYDRVYELTRLLSRRGAMEKAEALRLIETATAARLQAAGAENFKAVWGDLKADERTLPEIALAAAAIQDSVGNEDEASRILETAIGANRDPRLLSAYAQCSPAQVARRLSKAEIWLKSDPDNSALLAALGNLCLIGELWGQGERYLLRSMKLRSDMRIHALLGNLYDRLGRGDDAMKHWRLASGVAGALPVLPVNRALPAADTRGDPTLIDVVNLPEFGDGDAENAPVAASGADYLDHNVSDPNADALVVRPSQAEAKPTTVSKAIDTGLDEYFDSAPIPGVDLSQTSDRPFRGTGQH